MTQTDRLDELRGLSDGWLDGAGQRIGDAAISTIRSVLDCGSDFLSDAGLFPTPEGGVTIEFEHAGWDLSIEADHGGALEVYGVDLNSDQSFEPIAFDDAKFAVDQIRSLAA